MDPAVTRLVQGNPDWLVDASMARVLVASQAVYAGRKGKAMSGMSSRPERQMFWFARDRADQGPSAPCMRSRAGPDVGRYHHPSGSVSLQQIRLLQKMIYLAG